MIRVLHSVSNMDRGGIETMLMNYYRHIDRDKVQFDFIVNKKKPGDYDDEIRRLGGHIYQSPGLDPLHYPAYLRFVQQTVTADPRIRILHAHNEAMGLYALKGAEKAGLQVRIAHAHNIWIVRDYKWPLKMLCKQLLPGAATIAAVKAAKAQGKKTVFNMQIGLPMMEGMGVSKEMILARVWGYDSNAVENHVEVYVGFLRKKLTSIGSDLKIEAIRRLGYHLEVAE